MGFKAYKILILFLLLMAGGTIGYMLIERWPFEDSLYMTVITVSTVGYGELQPLSGPGRAFTSVLILVGVGMLAYAVRTWGSSSTRPRTRPSRPATS